MAIETIHEAVLKHLLDTKQEGFSLRTRDKRNEEKLSKGYWFLGNEGFLNLSFWDSRDWRNKTPSIFLGISSEGGTWLELVDKDGGEKAQFFQEIAPIIGLTQLKKVRNQEDRFFWKKDYGKDYLKHLDDFLKKDRPIIDAFIASKNKMALLPPISKEDFQKNLNYILERRKQFLEDCGCEEPVIISVKQTYPIRLKSIVFEKIGHFKHIQLNLDQQITCLIGENGSGKSTILRGIALGLAGIEGNKVINPDNIPIQKMLQIERIENRQEVLASKGQINIVYNDAQEKNIIDFEPILGETADKDGKIRYNDIKVTDLYSDGTATSDNYFRDLVLGFSQIKYQSNGNGQNGKENPDLRPRISEVTDLIYNLPDKSFDNFKSWIVKIWSATTSPAERENLIPVLETIFSTVQKIVGGVFELMPMEVEQKEIFIKTTDAPNGIPLRFISEGYMNVIGWVGYFMKRLWETPTKNTVDFKQTNAICLIDEIDTYLHPKWEKTILSVLANEFPNTQLVVTTHSPVVLSNLKNNYRIYTISKHNSLMMAFEHDNKDFNPYGAESSRILRMLMMPLVSERPENVQMMITQYNNAILENNFEAAEKFEQQLKELIDRNDPVLIEGEASIEARKMLQEL